MKNKNIIFIRFIAIVLVMFGHSIIIYSNSWGLYETINKSEILNQIKEVINIIQMPIFFCISGFLYYYSTKKDIRELSKNKFYRLIIPFIFIGLFYLLPIRYLIKYENYINEKLSYNIFVNLILGKDNGHLWYLPTLFFIFIISYCLLKIKEKRNINDYIYISLIAVVGLFDFNNLPYFGNISRYLIYFNIGYIINKRKIKIENKYVRWFIIILPLISILLNIKIINKNMQNTLIAILFCLGLFSCEFKVNNKVVEYISDNSYALYLLHSPLVYISYKFFPNINPIYMIVINFFAYGMICIIINEIIKRTKLKFILGK